MEWEDGWNKLRTWQSVQNSIIKQLGKEDGPLTLVEGVKPGVTISHPDEIHSLDHLAARDGDIFITNTGSDFRSYVNVWLMQHGKLQKKSISVASKIELLKYIPSARRVAMFTADCKLKLANDLTIGVQDKLHVLKVPTMIYCMEYNSDTDEVIVGGTGYVTNFKIKDDQFVGTTALDVSIEPTETVTEMRVDLDNTQLRILTGQTIYILNYRGNRVMHTLLNCHNADLSSCAFYRPKDMFITAAKDGSVKMWNCSVFTQVHQMFAHSGAITGLGTHPEDPLLITCSTDSFIKIWRLDTFELVHKLEAATRVLELGTLRDSEFYYVTKNDISIVECSMISRFYSTPFSPVSRLKYVSCVGLPGAVLSSTLDGAVRVIQPATGLNHTMVHPIEGKPKSSSKSAKKVKEATGAPLPFNDVVYIRREGSMHVLRQNEGDVLVFKASSNPCVPSQILTTDRQPKRAITALALLKKDRALGKQETSKCEHLIFSGHKNGEIALLHSRKGQLSERCLAHSKPIKILETSAGLVSAGVNVSPWHRDNLVSYAGDRKVRVWRLNVEAEDSDVFSLTAMGMIDMVESPTLLFLSGPVLAYTQSGQSKGSRLSMKYLKEDHPRTMESDGVTLLSPDTSSAVIERRAGGHYMMIHGEELDHSQPITGLDGHAKLHLFCTAAGDGLLKIWDKFNILVRQIQLDSTLSACCFADGKAGILFGYRNHINLVTIDSYLPNSWLQQVVLGEFTDEIFEDVLAHNASLKPRSLDMLPSYPAVDPDKNLRAATPPPPEGRVTIQEQATDAVLTEVKNNRSAGEDVKSWKKLGMSAHMAAKLGAAVKSGKGEIVTQRKPMRDSSDWTLHKKEEEVCKYRKSKEDLVKEERNKRLEFIRKMEEEAKKRKWFPIAPDGLIPNSMIREVLEDAASRLTEEEQAKIGQMAFLLSNLPTMDLAKSTQRLLKIRKQRRKVAAVDYQDTSVTKNCLVSERAKAKGLSELYWAAQPCPTVVDLGFVDGELIHIEPPEIELDDDTEGAGTEGRESTVTDRSASPTKSAKFNDDNLLLRAVLKQMSREPWWPRGMPLLASNAVNLLCRLLPRSQGRQHVKLIKYIEDLNGLGAIPANLKGSLETAFLRHIAANREDADILTDCLRLISTLNLKSDPVLLDLARLFTDSNLAKVRDLVLDVLKRFTRIVDEKRLLKAIKNGSFTTPSGTPKSSAKKPQTPRSLLSVDSPALSGPKSAQSLRGPSHSVVFGERKRKGYVPKLKPGDGAADEDDGGRRSVILRGPIPSLASSSETASAQKRKQVLKDYLDQEEAETLQEVLQVTDSLAALASDRVTTDIPDTGLPSAKSTSRSRRSTGSRRSSLFSQEGGYDVEAHGYFDEEEDVEEGMVEGARRESRGSRGSSRRGRASRGGRSSLGDGEDEFMWDGSVVGARKNFIGRYTGKTISDSGIFSAQHKQFEWQDGDAPGFEDRGASRMANSSLVISGYSYGPTTPYNVDEEEKRRNMRNLQERRQMAEARRALFFRDWAQQRSSLSESGEGFIVAGEQSFSHLGFPKKRIDLTAITKNSKSSVSKSLKAVYAKEGLVSRSAKLPRINASHTNLIKSASGRHEMEAEEEVGVDPLTLSPEDLPDEWRSAHAKYCEYYRMVRKKMQNYLSISKSLHSIAVAKNLCRSSRDYKQRIW